MRRSPYTDVHNVEIPGPTSEQIGAFDARLKFRVGRLYFLNKTSIPTVEI